MNQTITIQPVGSRVSNWGEGPIFFEDHLLYVDIEAIPFISGLACFTLDALVWCCEASELDINSCGRYGVFRSRMLWR